MGLILFFWLELFKILSVMSNFLNFSLACLSFEERGQIVLHLSLARSVGLSVDEVMSAQYLLTLCLKVAKLGTVDAPSE